MFKNVSLGIYYPGNSILHRLQARTKLLAMLVLIVSLIIANRHQWHFAPYIAILLLLAAGIVCSRISPREIWRRSWLLMAFLALGAISLLPTKEADARVLSSLGPLLMSYGLVRTILIGGAGLLVLVQLTTLLPGTRAFWQRRGLKWMRTPLWTLLGLVLLLLWLVSGSSERRPLALGPYVITYGGAWLLVTVSAVLIIFYVLSMLVTMTTSPVQLVEGMTMLLAPLRRLRLPVDNFALMALIALRFVPTLLEEVEQLIKAQVSRGADLSAGTLRERLQSLAMLFVSLMRGVLRRADELATALEARGYEVEGRQTFLHEMALGLLDYGVLAVIVVVGVCTLLL